jgi:uncharacterized protein (TIGR00251 family)
MPQEGIGPQGLRWSEGPGWLDLPVRAQPGASRDELVGVQEGALRIRVAAPPVEGAANDRLTAFVARGLLGVPRSAVELLRGQRGRDKLLRVQGEAADLKARLEAALSPTGPPRRS